MREIDYKKQVIETIPGVYNSEGVVTLITAGGMFSGKISEVKAYKIDATEDFSDKLKAIAKEEGEVKLKALALTLVDQIKQKLQNENWRNTDDLIHLEEVTFITNSGQEMSLPEITVSSNQVIAFLGGKASISK